MSPFHVAATVVEYAVPAGVHVVRHLTRFGTTRALVGVCSCGAECVPRWPLEEGQPTEPAVAAFRVLHGETVAACEAGQPIAPACQERARQRSPLARAFERARTIAPSLSRRRAASDRGSLALVRGPQA